MFNIPIGFEYVLPPPVVSADIPAVGSVKRPGQKRNRDKESTKNKKRTPFKQLLEKEAEEEFDKMGCFFETRV